MLLHLSSATFTAFKYNPFCQITRFQYALKSLFVTPLDPLSQSLLLKFQSLLLKIQSLRLKIQSLALKHLFCVLLKARSVQQFASHLPKARKCLQMQKSPFSSVVLPQFGFCCRILDRNKAQTSDEIGHFGKNPRFHRSFSSLPVRTSRSASAATERLKPSDRFETPTFQPFFY